MIVVGFISAVAFAFVNVPLILNIWRKKDSSGVTIGYLCLNYIGNIGALIYVIDSNLKTGEFQIPLYFNYCIATTCLVILTWLKKKYKNSEK